MARRGGRVRQLGPAAGWETVDSGLNLTYVGTLMPIIGMILLIMLAIVLPPLILTILALLLILVAHIVFIIGVGKCMSAPAPIAGLAKVGFWCWISAVIVQVLAPIIAMSAPENAQSFGLVAQVLTLIAGVTFLLFLRGIGKVFRNQNLATSVVWYIVAVPVTIGISIAMQRLESAVVGCGADPWRGLGAETMAGSSQ